MASLIASVYGEYEGCRFVEEELRELDVVSSHYNGLGGEIWIARPTDHQASSNLIIGCLAIVPACKQGVFELHKMYVAKHARGSGLAQRLYTEALHWATARDLQSLRLWTDIRFASGHRFYEKLGFAKQPVVRYLGDAGRTWEYLYICKAPQTP